MGFWDWIKPRRGGPDVPGAPAGLAEPQGPPAPPAPPMQDSGPAINGSGPTMQDRGPDADWWCGGVPVEVFDLSAAFESLRLRPYKDQGGVWTIGYGSTRDAAGHPVTQATPPITQPQAAAMARRDLADAAALALAAFPEGLPPRWGAVAILMANNLGDLRVKAQTLVRLLHAQQWRAAAEQLKAYRIAGGKPSTGLRRRRWAEAAYTLGMDIDVAYRRAWSEIRNPDHWPALPA